MQKLMFEIPGSPIGQGRPKFSTINGHAKAYDPEKSRNYKAYVRILATQAMKENDFEMITGPCAIKIFSYFSLPPPTLPQFKEAALASKERPTKKPDADNIVKATLPALNGLVYKDDSCIVELSCVKYYSDVPRVEVYVDEFA